MQPLNGKPTRRGMRRTLRGIPTGRRVTHAVQTQPGRHHKRREWDALMAIVFASRRAEPDGVACGQADDTGEDEQR